MPCSSATRATTRSATSTAFSPGFLVICSVTAGCSPLARAGPDVARGLRRAVEHLRPRRARTPAGRRSVPTTRLAHVGGRFEVVAGLDHHLAVVAHEAARRAATTLASCSALRTSSADDAVRVHAVGVQQHAHRAPGPAERLHLARAGHALQLDLGGVRDALQLVGAALRVLAPQRQRHHRHVVDALGLDDRLDRCRRSGDTQSRFELIVSYRRTSASVCGTPTLNCTVSTAMPGRDTEYTCSMPVICASTCSAGVATSASTSRAEAPGNGTKHVRHGDVDLRLFLARRDRHGEQAEQERHQRQQRRELRVPGRSARCGRRCPCVEALRARAAIPALIGSSATRSPGFRPASTSTDAFVARAAQANLAHVRAALLVHARRPPVTSLRCAPPPRAAPAAAARGR